MDFFDVIKKRRSIRKFTEQKTPEDVIEKSLQAAILAPNSSNAQTWNFIWVRSSDHKNKVAHLCLDQSAARTCSDLVIFVASPEDWTRSWSKLVSFVESINAPAPVKLYYKSQYPNIYRRDALNIAGFIKKIIFIIKGLKKPFMNKPTFNSELAEVSIKSTALAAENFVLAITAQGYASCMMEGFDERRLKSYLKLKSSERIVMVVAVGEEAPNGTWGPQYRLPYDQVVKKI